LRKAVSSAASGDDLRDMIGRKGKGPDPRKRSVKASPPPTRESSSRENVAEKNLGGGCLLKESTVLNKKPVCGTSRKKGLYPRREAEHGG